MRLYLGTTDGFDATVSGVLQGAWSGGLATPAPMYLDKTTAPSGIWNTFQFGGGVGVGNLFMLQVYPFAVATDLSGTLQLCIPAYSAFAPEQDPHFKCHAWVSAGKTSTVRGTLLDNYTEAAGATNRLELTQLARSLIAPQTVTPVSAQAGDYLHVEIGYVYQVAPGNAACYYEVGPKDAGGTVLPDYTTDQLAYSGGAWQGVGWVEIEPTAPMGHNLLTGAAHTVEGSDNLIIGGVAGSVTGNRNVLISLRP